MLVGFWVLSSIPKKVDYVLRSKEVSNQDSSCLGENTWTTPKIMALKDIKCYRG
jgi:hypothetical protein